MDQRVQFIADYQRAVFDIAELARRYGISRKTAYKWIERYEIGGPAGLVDRSRRPAHCLHRTPPAIIAALLEVRRHHPTWGASAIDHRTHGAASVHIRVTASACTDIRRE